MQTSKTTIGTWQLGRWLALSTALAMVVSCGKKKKSDDDDEDEVSTPVSGETVDSDESSGSTVIVDDDDLVSGPPFEGMLRLTMVDDSAGSGLLLTTDVSRYVFVTPQPGSADLASGFSGDLDNGDASENNGHELTTGQIPANPEGPVLIFDAGGLGIGDPGPEGFAASDVETIIASGTCAAVILPGSATLLASDDPTDEDQAVGSAVTNVSRQLCRVAQALLSDVHENDLPLDITVRNTDWRAGRKAVLALLNAIERVDGDELSMDAIWDIDAALLGDAVQRGVRAKHHNRDDDSGVMVSQSTANTALFDTAQEPALVTAQFNAPEGTTFDEAAVLDEADTAIETALAAAEIPAADLADFKRNDSDKFIGDVISEVAATGAISEDVVTAAFLETFQDATEDLMGIGAAAAGRASAAEMASIRACVEEQLADEAFDDLADCLKDAIDETDKIISNSLLNRLGVTAEALADEIKGNEDVVAAIDAAGDFSDAASDDEALLTLVSALSEIVIQTLGDKADAAGIILDGSLQQQISDLTSQFVDALVKEQQGKTIDFSDFNRSCDDVFADLAAEGLDFSGLDEFVDVTSSESGAVTLPKIDDELFSKSGAEFSSAIQVYLDTYGGYIWIEKGDASSCPEAKNDGVRAYSFDDLGSWCGLSVRIKTLDCNLDLRAKEDDLFEGLIGEVQTITGSTSVSCNLANATEHNYPDENPCPSRAVGANNYKFWFADDGSGESGTCYGWVETSIFNCQDLAGDTDTLTGLFTWGNWATCSLSNGEEIPSGVKNDGFKYTFQYCYADPYGAAGSQVCSISKDVVVEKCASVADQSDADLAAYIDQFLDMGFSARCWATLQDDGTPAPFEHADFAYGDQWTYYTVPSSDYDQESGEWKNVYFFQRALNLTTCSEVIPADDADKAVSFADWVPRGFQCSIGEANDDGSINTPSEFLDEDSSTQYMWSCYGLGDGTYACQVYSQHAWPSCDIYRVQDDETTPLSDPEFLDLYNAQLALNFGTPACKLPDGQDPNELTRPDIAVDDSGARYNFTFNYCGADSDTCYIYQTQAQSCSELWLAEANNDDFVNATTGFWYSGQSCNGGLSATRTIEYSTYSVLYSLTCNPVGSTTVCGFTYESIYRAASWQDCSYFADVSDSAFVSRFTTEMDKGYGYVGCNLADDEDPATFDRTNVTTGETQSDFTFNYCGSAWGSSVCYIYQAAAYQLCSDLYAPGASGVTDAEFVANYQAYGSACRLGDEEDPASFTRAGLAFDDSGTLYNAQFNYCGTEWNSAICSIGLTTAQACSLTWLADAADAEFVEGTYLFSSSGNTCIGGATSERVVAYPDNGYSVSYKLECSAAGSTSLCAMSSEYIYGQAATVPTCDSLYGDGIDSDTFVANFAGQVASVGYASCELADSQDPATLDRRRVSTSDGYHNYTFSYCGDSYGTSTCSIVDSVVVACSGLWLADEGDDATFEAALSGFYSTVGQSCFGGASDSRTVDHAEGGYQAVHDLTCTADGDSTVCTYSMTDNPL